LNFIGGVSEKAVDEKNRMRVKRRCFMGGFLVSLEGIK
jgi:hypothetical protein